MASVTDSQGHPVVNPTVRWTVSDTAIAGTLGYNTIDSTFGKAAGTVVVRATSGVFSDSITVQAADSGALDPVNVVEMAPDSLNLPLAVDSLGVYAQPYSADHTPLYDRPIAWLISDSTVARLTSFGRAS